MELISRLERQLNISCGPLETSQQRKGSQFNMENWKLILGLVLIMIAFFRLCAFLFNSFIHSWSNTLIQNSAQISPTTRYWCKYQRYLIVSINFASTWYFASNHYSRHFLVSTHEETIISKLSICTPKTQKSTKI